MKTFSKVLAVVLCICMLFTTALASGLQVSFVDFQEADGAMKARVSLKNDDSEEALSGKLIVASYDENGTLIAMNESPKAILEKGNQAVLSASVASDGADYKAFVWKDSIIPGSKHAVKGATTSADFVYDTATSKGFVSSGEVATTAMDVNIEKAYVKLYSPFVGRSADDASEETGGRFTTMASNSVSYHEAYYVDPAYQGYDFFVFGPGNIDYSKYESLLEFEIAEDAEIIILSSSDAQEFEGFELTKAADVAADGETFAKARYMDRQFADSLNAVGIRPTYAIAKAYNEDKETCYTENIKPAYDAASDEAKAKFDENWEIFAEKKSYTETAPYIAAYTRTFTTDGEASAKVVIPAESTGTVSRNLVVLVKPLNNGSELTGSTFAPVTKAAVSSAAPALKGVEIDGEYVSIDEFTGNEYTYKLDAMSGCILPVVKGITVDNSIYAAVDYNIAEGANTATITVTAKNLYTEADPVVYTINVEVDASAIPSDAYDVVNLNGTEIVDNTNVLAKKTKTVEGIKTHGDPLVAAPVTKVSGMTYAQYIAYINEYYGYEEGDAEYIVGTGVSRETDVVGTNSYFRYAKDFEVGNALGTESNRRQIASINPTYAFYRNLYRMYSSISLSQLGGHGFTGGLWYGKDHEYVTGYNANAGTDKLPAVPWFEATMATKGTVYVNSYAALPHLVERGYKLISNDIAPYTGVDTKSTYDDTSDDANFTTPKYIYYKVFEAGETVEIFNDNHQVTGNFHPSAWFFTTGVPDEYSYEYGKMSNGVAATSYASDHTNGVLYKDLFADEASSRDTTGGQWTSDYQPLGAGQRIYSLQDPSLAGCDYFAFSIGNRNYTGSTNLLEFKVDKDSEVVILTKAQDNSAVFGDFTKNTNDPSLTAMFPQANYIQSIKELGIPATDISMDMVADFYPSSGLTFRQLYDKWLGAEFPGASEEELLAAVNTAARKTSLATELDKISADTQLFASVDSVAAAIGGSHVIHPYTVTHTKEFKAGDTVAIPVPTGDTSFDRPIIVVAKPKVNSTITDHVADFQIVASTGEGSFILGPGANATAKATFSDRLVHNYSTEPGEADVASAYSINAQRIFGVTDEILGLENCYYLKYVNQASVDSVLKGTAQAQWIGGADKEDLAWMTFKVNQDCDIVIVPSAETPKFVTREENGWSKTALSDYAFTLTRKTNNSGGTYQDYTAKSQKVMYTKSFKAGDTVTLYNGNNGTATMSYDMLPYFAFVRVK